MTKKKVELAFITNDSARKVTFNKRKKGLLKKVNELSTLCGIEACAVIYSPFESQPEIWPSLVEAREVATKFRELPEMEQSKKMFNQESYLRQQILKASEQLKKQRKENRENDITQVMYQCIAGNTLNNLTMSDLNDLELLIDQYLFEIGREMDNFKMMSGTTQMYPDMNVGTSNVGGSHQLAHDQIGHPVHEAMHMQQHQQQQQPQPENWFMDPINSQEGVHVHGGLGVGGILGDEMMLPFVDTNNIHFNGSQWSGAFFP